MQPAASSAIPSPARHAPDMHSRIAVILSLIEANLQGSLKASDLARRANLSMFRFLHVFKDEMGESFGRYCNRLRMERVRELLEAGTQDLESIAFQVGLPSSKALAYHFKRRFQVPPSKYRRKLAAAHAPSP